jgi:transposase
VIEVEAEAETEVAKEVEARILKTEIGIGIERGGAIAVVK